MPKIKPYLNRIIESLNKDLDYLSYEIPNISFWIIFIFFLLFILINQ